MPDTIKATVTATIRACAEDDLPALEWMGLYSRHRRIIRETFEAQRRGDGLMLLAVASGFPIAQAWLDFARKRDEGTAVIWAVRTFPPLRGTGIGRQMMAAAEAALRERGIRRAELEIDQGNEAALAFYLRLGWRVAHDDGEDGRRLLEKAIPPPGRGGTLEQNRKGHGSG